MSSATVWAGMMSRCYNPKNSKYHCYGGCGVQVCDRWHDRNLFVQDVGVKPEGLSLNRIDNDGPYSPENCEWATYRDQAQNRRDNNVTYNGETKCLTEWERITGIYRKTLDKRIKKGWPLDKVFKTPVLKDQTRRNEWRAEYAVPTAPSPAKESK
jgi:hypothetical protein